MDFSKFESKNLIKKGENFTPVNEVLSYGVTGNNLHFHLIPEYSFNRQDLVNYLRTGEVPKQIIDGLNKLSLIVQSKKEIKKVSATSTIVFEHPEIFEKLGFAIHGQISDEIKEKLFKTKNKDISYAEISREDFLSRYNNMEL